jgi:hypothetical protein
LGLRWRLGLGEARKNLAEPGDDVRLQVVGCLAVQADDETIVHLLTCDFITVIYLYFFHG